MHDYLKILRKNALKPAYLPKLNAWESFIPYKIPQRPKK
jgi:hypothetical protein